MICQAMGKRGKFPELVSSIKIDNKSFKKFTVLVLNLFLRVDESNNANNVIL